jgi:hypothetical protein
VREVPSHSYESSRVESGPGSSRYRSREEEAAHSGYDAYPPSAYGEAGSSYSGAAGDGEESEEEEGTGGWSAGIDERLSILEQGVRDVVEGHELLSSDLQRLAGPPLKSLSAPLTCSDTGPFAEWSASAATPAITFKEALFALWQRTEVDDNCDQHLRPACLEAMPQLMALGSLLGLGPLAGGVLLLASLPAGFADAPASQPGLWELVQPRNAAVFIYRYLAGRGGEADAYCLQDEALAAELCDTLAATQAMSDKPDREVSPYSVGYIEGTVALALLERDPVLRGYIETMLAPLQDSAGAGQAAPPASVGSVREVLDRLQLGVSGSEATLRGLLEGRMGDGRMAARRAVVVVGALVLWHWCVTQTALGDL